MSDRIRTQCDGPAKIPFDQNQGEAGCPHFGGYRDSFCCSVVDSLEVVLGVLVVMEKGEGGAVLLGGGTGLALFFE